MARTRDIRTNQLDIACDVCGRTLLRGEQAETYLAGGSRRQVCDLCTARAEHEGWIRESGGDDLALRHTRHDGRGGGSSTACARAASARARSQAEEVARGRRGRRRSGTTSASAGRRPAARRPRQVRAVPTNADLKMQRALEVFNASDHTRTVGGSPARSARPPCACARAPTARPWCRSP